MKTGLQLHESVLAALAFVTTFLFAAAVLVNLGVSVHTQSSDGQLTIINNSQSNDFTAENLTVRTVAYICSGGLPLPGSTPLLPTEQFDQIVTNQTYSVLTYNEVVALGDGAVNTYMSSNGQYHGFVCSGVIPAQTIATINSVSPDNQTLVTISGQTDVTLQGGIVPGRELPVIQAIAPQGGLSTGIRIVQVDLRSDTSGGIASPDGAVATACIDDQFTVANDVASGDYGVAAGSYSVERAQGGPEIFACLEETQTSVTVPESGFTQITYIEVDEQSGFFGTTSSTQLIPQQQNGGDQPEPADDPIVSDQNSNQTPNTNQPQALLDNNANALGQSNNAQGNGLIRSGAFRQVTPTLVLLAVCSLALADTTLSRE